ncbi:hypothetical protein OAD50_04725 [Vicingaceae bacterium]|nr:hypothetical protein [Vicingaceae bacterium]
MNRAYIMNYVLFGTLILRYFVSSAQVLFPLHPSVGDTIDSVEKLDYSLFTNTDNKEFNFAIIQYINSNFTLVENRSEEQLNGLLTKINDSITLTQEQIIKEQQKIEKINSYYYNLVKEDKYLEQKEGDRVLEKKIPIRFAGTKKERLMLKRARLCRFDENKLNNEFETGLRPGKDQQDIKQ